MKTSVKEKAINKQGTNADSLRMLKHDINNQLSNISLALEQLRYEIPDASEDCTFYLDSILMSSVKINTLLKESESQESPKVRKTE
jgi:nitrogen-specific signal transduction histidine kinase